jgi:hypothetical protein
MQTNLKTFSLIQCELSTHKWLHWELTGKYKAGISEKSRKSKMKGKEANWKQ